MQEKTNAKEVKTKPNTEFLKSNKIDKPLARLIKGKIEINCQYQE